MGLGAFAFPQLRTLAGSNPSAWRRWLDFLNARRSRLIWDGGFRVRLFGGRVPLRRFAPCVLRWKTLRVSSAPHPGGSIPSLAHKKAPRADESPGRSVTLAGTEDSNPQQPAPKTGVLPLNYVPVWVLPKATRLVYLICEGIANAIEQAYRERLGVAGSEGAVVARHAGELNADACRLLLCGDIGGADALGQVVALGEGNRGAR